VGGGEAVVRYLDRYIDLLLIVVWVACAVAVLRAL
jgi:hypothetical protein